MLRSMGSQRVRHNSVTELQEFQTTGESHSGHENLVGHSDNSSSGCNPAAGPEAQWPKMQAKEMVISICLRACLLSRVQSSEAPWTVARQVLLSMGFSSQEYWGRLLAELIKIGKMWKQSKCPLTDEMDMEDVGGVCVCVYNGV